MSSQTKTVLIVLGVLSLCGLCGLGSFVLYKYWPQTSQTTLAATQTPAPTATAELTIALKPSATATSRPTGEKIPYHSVVQITAQVDDGGEIVDEWTGSGTIISRDGLILTNAHVVLPEMDYPVDHLLISMTGNPDEVPEPTYYAEVMQADANLDLAVIRIKTDLDGNEVSMLDLPAVPIGDSDALSLGDKLSILGYPGIGGQTITLTSGEVSGFTGEASYGNRAFIKTNATIAGGNSGGLAVNERGELVGVPTQLGAGGGDDQEFVDCRVLADTNGDGTIDNNDTCIPTGGFINSLRPVKLALPFIERARNGQVDVAAEINTPTNNPQSPDDQGVLYTENFSDSSSGWEDYADNEGGAGYVNGKYQIEIKSTNLVRWGVSQNSFSDANMAAHVDITHATGEGDYGFVCRYIDADNFYALEVSEDGYAAIWKLAKGEVKVLSDWQYVGADSGASHDISASCVGNELSISLDGEEAAYATDSEFQIGDIGLIAGTNNVKGLSVAFDNVVVTAP